MLSTSPHPRTARGLRLSYLRHFINSHGGESRFAGKTTAQVCFEFVVPLTEPSELSLVDHIANDPSTASFVAPANWYVSHAWQYLFLETVDSLERFFSDRGLADDAVIWFCVFNNNQHLASSYPFEYWSSTFKNGFAAIGNVVMIMHPWNDPIVLRRSWCVFEVYVAVTLGARFEIALAQDQEATFLNDIAEEGAMEGMLATIKSEDSETTVPSDRDGIFALIRAETSFTAVDRLIFSTLSNWIKAALEASIASAPTLAEKAARWRHLGFIYDRSNHDIETERCFRHAVALFTQANGPNDLETFKTQSALAICIAFQRKPKTEWEPLFLSTLSALADLLGAAHETTLVARLRLTVALSWNGDHHGALTVGLGTLDLQRATFGLRHWRTAGTLSAIGGAYNQLYMYRVGTRYLRRALLVQEETLGPDHTSTRSTVSRLTNALLNTGDVVRALPMAERLVASSERILGPLHDTAIFDKITLGAALLMAGKSKEAQTLLTTLDAILEGRPELTARRPTVRGQIAIAFWSQGQYEEATNYFVRALDLSHHRKETVWLFLLMASTIASQAVPLARARHYVESATDPTPETWPASCLVCGNVIVGCVVMCKGCPGGISKFCTSCLARKVARLQQLCKHDPSTTTYTTTPPPRRFFLEKDLLEASYDRVEMLWVDYASYCTMHNVPLHERLRRTSVPVLNRSDVAATRVGRGAGEADEEQAARARVRTAMAGSTPQGYQAVDPDDARRRRAPPRTRLQLPTRHLGFDEDFYEAPAVVAAAAELRLPDAILPKYADFVYQVMLRAVKFRAHLHWLDRADQACLFCPAHETYRHFLVDCDFIKDVWSTLHAVTVPLGVTLPTTLSGYLYSTPKTASNMHQAAFRYLWPVLRACVWFNVWRVRNDRVFRADLPLPSPWTIAVKAARVAQLHVHHSQACRLSNVVERGSAKSSHMLRTDWLVCIVPAM
ncbi:hypothetical protein SPRG_21109 [Saprolegnia parasitica CBS 223.65]|uniref:Uncharacterized protein n=1 Tax=Saprolegnia parasitica (strain CBS 223.65) TaxID=695850 RepID=A0A067C760_SAPPC|nr:hypothetical protein SPRG_21109 [Saprolegnia parasitica CBS 223.65]KDO22627.1 hypothetical protein SPRG_21109 [Saprolegnia parasitica CBS 223.65]|eukprot:XP_012206664.1 hypothetical protein SPRG_21109 [Saprolegnia parasitica CBS 223.65]